MTQKEQGKAVEHQQKKTIRDYMRYAKMIAKGYQINPEFKNLFL
jgi:hypothetical protein